MKSSSVYTAATAALVITLLTGCDGLKSAMTAHVDMAARAGSQELSVTRLAELMTEVPAEPEEEIAKAIANAWIDYQLLGQQAASGDTIIEKKLVDEAMWSVIARSKASKFYTQVSQNWGQLDSGSSQKAYADGDVLAASHILFLTQGKTDEEKATARKKAESVLGQVTSDNFGEMASKHSEEPGAAGRAGALGVFGKGEMVPEFEAGLLALEPGGVSPIVESQFGYHIIRRAKYDEVKDQLGAQVGKAAMQHAEREFIEKLQNDGKLDIKSGAAPTVLEVLKDPAENLDNKKILATSAAGKFTAGRLAEWLQIMPPDVVQQQRMMLEGAPDSVVDNLVKNFVTNELVIRAADSAKLGPTEEELEDVRRQFFESRSNAWMQLGVTPMFLADSNRTAGERERLAASRIDKYLENLTAGRAPFAEVPPQLSAVLRKKAKTSINKQGLERAVQEAIVMKSRQDSIQKATEPSSMIPMPGEEDAPDSE